MAGITRRRFAAGAAAIAATSLSAQNKAPGPGHIYDCCNHTIGPARYPMLSARAYTPPEANVADLLAFRKRLGITHTILIQPSLYGFDNRCMTDALAALGDRARGIAVVPNDISDAALADLHRHGVRGLRVNFESVGKRQPTGAAEALEALAPRAAAHGMHLQLYAVLPVIAAIAARIAALPVPLVIDHFGMPRAEKGLAQPGFAALLELVRIKKIFVKLSAPYRISDRPNFEDVAPIARALIKAGPDRMVWGSDWPHTDRSAPSPTMISPFRRVDDAAVLSRLADWCGDAAIHRMILEETPAKLYGF